MRAGALRPEPAEKYADKYKLFEQTGTEADFKFLWVTDFPMYEWDEETKTWNAAAIRSPHHMRRTSWQGALTSDKGAVRALAYDIVLNGTELVGLHSYSSPGRAGRDLPVAGYVGGRGEGAVWILS